MKFILSTLILISIIANSIHAEDLALNEIATLTVGDSSDSYGMMIESAGDINNDGYKDVWVYQFRNRDYTEYEPMSSVYLYYGGNPMDSIPDFIITDTIFAIANMGDMNQDGFDDFVVWGNTGAGGNSFLA